MVQMAISSAGQKMEVK
jgi:hypothetical protein